MEYYQWSDPDRVKAAIATAFYQNKMKSYAEDVLTNERHVHLYHHWQYQVPDQNSYPVVMFLVEGSPAKGWGHITYSDFDEGLIIELFTVSGRGKKIVIPFEGSNKENKIYQQYAKCYGCSRKFKLRNKDKAI